MASRGMLASPTAKSQERIYSANQLSQALRSGLDAVRDQLQVLTILDGTAASWPGVNQAIDDLSSLIDMSAQTATRMESEVHKCEARLMDCKSENATLKETLSSANSKRDELAKEAAQAAKDVRQLNSKLEAAGKDIHQQRQELWTLEKQRADLASEAEKYKQDNEFMDAEISSLRATVTDQMQQVSTLKADLAAHKTELQHLKQSSAEQRVQANEQRKQLEATSVLLRTAQKQLEQVRGEKQHLDKENVRLAEETSRLASELSKVSGDAARQKDWGEVVKKVEADKLNEEQKAHAKTRMEFEQARSELEKTIVRLTAELASKEQLAAAKTSEASNLAKQLGLFNVQLKDLQKQLTTTQAERAAAARERDVCKADVAKLQAQVQAGALQAAQLDKERALAEGRAKEMSTAEKSKVQLALEEARKEAAVHKALADGWARDIKDLQSRLEAQQTKMSALQELVDSASKRNAGEGEKHTEMIKSIATMEQVIRDLKAQLTNKDTEMRKLKAETASMLKLSEKQIEKLQRECNESAAEIQRLRSGDAFRLPPLATRPTSLQDELDCLKRYAETRDDLQRPNDDDDFTVD